MYISVYLDEYGILRIGFMFDLWEVMARHENS